jgi:hypothetical protein
MTYLERVTECEVCGGVAIDGDFVHITLNPGSLDWVECEGSGGSRVRVEPDDAANEKLYPTDRLVRRTTRVGMYDGTRLTIEFISGFEKFNTRPYHNYETWGQGWRITDPESGVVVEREDLHSALQAWIAALGGTG